MLSQRPFSTHSNYGWIREVTLAVLRHLPSCLSRRKLPLGSFTQRRSLLRRNHPLERALTTSSRVIAMWPICPMSRNQSPLHHPQLWTTGGFSQLDAGERFDSMLPNGSVQKMMGLPLDGLADVLSPAASQGGRRQANVTLAINRTDNLVDDEASHPRSIPSTSAGSMATIPMHTDHWIAPDMPRMADAILASVTTHRTA